MARRKQSLKAYREKRDFTLTPEPEPAGAGGKAEDKALIYAVQRHDARRLHFDLRLELDGVLLSWAVTSEPEAASGKMRLAVRTEAHPLRYADFAGTIPKGQYGGGTVALWDRGTWIPEGDPRAGLRKGHLRFQIDGKRLHGEWHLVRMKPEGKRENWLFFPSPQERVADEGEETHTRTIEELRHLAGGVQLATLSESPPSGNEWWHEMKWDGYRLLGFFAGGKSELRSRNGLDWTVRFPAIRECLQQLPARSGIVDMEAVVLDSSGRSSFSALQSALRDEDGRRTIVGMAFDLLHLDGKDLRSEPLRERKKLLRPLLAGQEALRLSDHIAGDGSKVYEEACKRGLEGIVSKNSASRYRSGRGSDWIKVKCRHRQEFLVLGYRMAKGGSQKIGALYLGYRDGTALRYAGKTGTGFTASSSSELEKRFSAYARDRAVLPHEEMAPLPVREWSEIRWVTPRFPAEVEFAEWTKDNRLRHAVFQGIREDKEVKQVVREASRQGIEITHAERVICAETGTTKGDVAHYYDALASTMLPLLARRPLSIVRCPDGLAASCFYQRKAGRGWGSEVKPFSFRHHGKSLEFFYIETAAGLLQLVQMGAIEFHPWCATIDDIAHPDQMIFDLDPSPELPFAAVKLAAKDLRARLQKLGFTPTVKCTGGKGLHIRVPLAGGVTWEESKRQAAEIANQMAADAPDAYVAVMSKSKRKGRIFIDYFRNDVTATAIADYSLRARTGLPVAAPLRWNELGRLLRADAIDRKKAQRRAARGIPET